MIGDKVTHNDKTWVSIVDNNVWEPGASVGKIVFGDFLSYTKFPMDKFLKPFILTI